MSGAARFCLIPLLILALLPRAIHAAGDATLDQLRRQQRDAIIRAEERFPSLGQRDPRDVIQFALTPDLLTARTRIGPTADSVTLQLKGQDGLAEMRIRAAPESAQSFVWFHYYDFSDPAAQYALTEIYIRPNGFQIAKSIQYPDKTCIISFVNSQAAPPTALLSVQTIAEPSGQVIVDHRFPISSLLQLRREHCDDVDLYLRPIFRQFNQEAAILPVDDSAACQALGQDAASDPTVAAVAQAALAQMNSDDYPQRQAASAKLRSLGIAGILYLFSLDRSALSPEQSVRVGEIIRPFRGLAASDIARLRDDPDFLLDCLASDDTLLRRLALSRFSKIVGRPITLDDKLSPDQRSAEIQKLRDSLNPSPSPATAPAK